MHSGVSNRPYSHKLLTINNYVNCPSNFAFARSIYLPIFEKNLMRIRSKTDNVGIGRSVGGSICQLVGWLTGRRVSRQAGTEGGREGALDGGFFVNITTLPMLCAARALSHLLYVIILYLPASSRPCE